MNRWINYGCIQSMDEWKNEWMCKGMDGGMNKVTDWLMSEWKSNSIKE